MWYLAMQNNDLMNQKGSVAIPAAIKHTADVETISDSESDSSLVKNKKRKQKATPHDHSGATLTC